MRNLLLFILLLIGVFYVRRALRRLQRGDSGDSGGAEAGAGRRGAAPAPQIEQMLACAHCGLHVPESEGVRSAEGFFCSEAHRRLGPHP